MRANLQKRQDPRRRRLHEWGTYARTRRLEDMEYGAVKPTFHDVVELFATWREGSATWAEKGERPTLEEFAVWLLKGAHVTW